MSQNRFVKIVKVIFKILMHIIIWPLAFVGMSAVVVLPTLVLSDKYQHVIYPFPVQESGGSGIFFFDFPWIRMLIGLALCIPLMLYLIFHHKTLKRTMISLIFIIPLMAWISVDFYKTTLVRSTDSGCYQQPFGVFKYFDMFKMKECKDISTLNGEVNKLKQLIEHALSCPENTVSYNGECVSCDTADDLVVFSDYEARLLKKMCPNRVFGDDYSHYFSYVAYSFLHKGCPNGFGGVYVSAGGLRNGITCYDKHEPTRIHVGDNSVLIQECQQAGRIVIDKYCYLPCAQENSFYDSEGRCHSCDEDIEIKTTEIDCMQSCHNRAWSSAGGRRNQGIGSYDYLGGCKLKEACPDGFVYDHQNKCQSCDEPEIFWSTEEVCQSCPNRYAFKYPSVKEDRVECRKKCGLNEFFDVEHTCHSCNDLKMEIQITFGNDTSKEKKPAEEACRACSNRKVKDVYCTLEKCPDGSMENDYDHKCIPCETEEAFYCDDRGDCKENCIKVCGRKWEGNRCIPVCPKGQMYVVAKETCEKEEAEVGEKLSNNINKIELPVELRADSFVGLDGKNYPCDTAEVVRISLNDIYHCIQCSNRKIGNFITRGKDHVAECQLKD